MKKNAHGLSSGCKLIMMDFQKKNSPPPRKNLLCNKICYLYNDAHFEIISNFHSPQNTAPWTNLTVKIFQKTAKLREGHNLHTGRVGCCQLRALVLRNAKKSWSTKECPTSASLYCKRREICLWMIFFKKVKIWVAKLGKNMKIMPRMQTLIFFAKMQQQLRNYLPSSCHTTLHGSPQPTPARGCEILKNGAHVVVPADGGGWGWKYSPGVIMAGLSFQ